MTGKGCTGENQRESIIRVWDISDDTIDPSIGSGDEGLLDQPATQASSKTHIPWCLYGEMTLIAFMRLGRAAALL